MRPDDNMLSVLRRFKKHRKFAADGTSLADEASADSDLFSSSTHINASASPGKAKGRVAPGLEEGVAVGGRPTRAEKKRLRVYCRAIEEHRARRVGSLHLRFVVDSSSLPLVDCLRLVHVCVAGCSDKNTTYLTKGCSRMTCITANGWFGRDWKTSLKFVQ